MLLNKNFFRVEQQQRVNINAGPKDCQKLYPNGGTPFVIANLANEYPDPQINPNRTRSTIAFSVLKEEGMGSSKNLLSWHCIHLC